MSDTAALAGTVGDILAGDEPRPAAKPERHSVTVRKIGAELQKALQLRQLLAGDPDPQLLIDTIEGETDLAEACSIVFEETLIDAALSDGLALKIAELQERKNRIEKSIETRRIIIQMAMDKAGLGTIRSPLATLSLRDTQPKLVVDEESAIPSRFFVPTDPKLDRAAVKAALEAGEQVPGAKLGHPGISLTIRIK